MLPSLQLPSSLQLPVLALAIAGALTSSLQAQGTAEWIYHKTADGLHPDGNEQQLVWLMNRARSNPPAEGAFLANSGDPDIASGITYFKVDVPRMRREFDALTAQPPAAFDRRLYEASRAHSLDLIARNAQDHNGQFERITAAGFTFQQGTVSVFAYSQSAMEAHGALNIDWGGPAAEGGMQAGRGHRMGIMGNLPNVGFAMVPETNPNTQVGPLVFSGAYGTALESQPNHYNRFITGTVWTDANNNDRYDPGEGMNNVRVQPDIGPWHAITGAGGGWAFPASNGTFNLTISGGTLTAPITRMVTVGSGSALADVEVVPSVAPLTLTAARQGASLVLTWSGGVPPYRLQSSTTLAANSWQNVGAATNATTTTITPTAPRNFYRVIDRQ